MHCFQVSFSQSPAEQEWLDESASGRQRKFTCSHLGAVKQEALLFGRPGLPLFLVTCGDTGVDGRRQ